MNIEELFAGIGVVIDDKVFSSDEQGDRIVTIVKELENVRKFPLVKYADLPDNEALSKLTNVSFLLLDWEIEPMQDALGDDAPNVQLGDVLKEENEKRVIEIVKQALRDSLVPVFIFSNQDIETIKRKLTTSEIDLEKSQIFIKSKSELVEDGALFSKIGEWVDGVSGVYVAKAWENAFIKAKNQFFAEMANNTSHWPKSLFQAATDDSTDPGEEITQAISQNIISRMQPIAISQDQIDKDAVTPTKEEVLGIMKGQFFLEKGADASMVGDFYKKGSKYYMNIRPTCDCVSRDGNSDYVYLLNCGKIKPEQVGDYFENGHFKETIGTAVVGPLFENCIYRVFFKELKKEEYSQWKGNKVGRILPPIINHITERYGLYVQRQALPRIPKEIVPVIPQEALGKEQNQGCLATLLKPVIKK
jgi:hypothetical protein